MTPGGNPRGWKTLVASLAAGVFLLGCAPSGEDPLLLRENGIGPLQLGKSYQKTVAAARQAAPETVFAGLGCGGLDEVRYSGEFEGLPVSAMAMAEEGAIVEIELTVDAPTQTAGEAACIALRDRFARPFVTRFGAVDERWVLRKPVSREHLARIGPVVMVARWFRTGGSCYVSAHYGYGAASKTATWD